MTVNIRKIIHQIISAFNLPIAPGTTEFLLQVLQQHELQSAKDIEEAIEGIMSSLFIEQPQTTEISRQALEPIIVKLSQDASVDSSASFATEQVYHITKIPQFTFNRHQHVFLEVEKPKSSTFGQASDKSSMFRDRFDVIKQSIQRAQMYQHVDDKIQITPIKNLLGCEGQIFTLLGMLSCLKQGEIHLEDLDASVKLFIDEDVQLGVGLFVETCIVLVEGVYFGPSGFKATAIHMPPIESRLESLKAHKRLDMFGGDVPLVHPNLLKKMISSTSPASSVTLISDFWMDNVEVMNHFDKYLETVEDVLEFQLTNPGTTAPYNVPICIVLMGDFHSPGFQGTLYQWPELWKLIGKYAKVCKYVHFIFVPGPNDPWCPGMLPQPAIPESISKWPRKSPLKKELIHFGENPCRIRFGGAVSSGYDSLTSKPQHSLYVMNGEDAIIGDAVGRDMLICRFDVASKMSRNVILKPNVKQEPAINKHLVKTLLSQCHLSPVNPNLTPVVWSQDYKLRLYPLPDLLVLADRTTSYKLLSGNSVVCNPGSFATNNFTYMTYQVPTGNVEDLNL